MHGRWKIELGCSVVPLPRDEEEEEEEESVFAHFKPLFCLFSSFQQKDNGTKKMPQV